MSIAICAAGQMWFASGVSIEDARACIGQGIPIKVWWFASNGTRYTETVWIPEESLEYIRTESDD